MSVRGWLMGAVVVAAFAVGGCAENFPGELARPIAAKNSVSELPKLASSPVIFEDEAGWNCLTMGNRECGPEFLPLTAEDVAGFQQTEDVTGAHPWSACLVETADTSTLVCPDGWVETS